MAFAERIASANRTVLNRFDKIPGLIGTETVLGIFDEPTKSTDIYDGSVLTTAPSFLVDTADALANGVVYQTPITIKNTLYSVEKLLPDGAGLTRLILTT